MLNEFLEIKDREIETVLKHYFPFEAKINGIKYEVIDKKDLKYQLSKIRNKILDYTHQPKIEYSTPDRADALYHIWAEITTDLIKHLNALLDKEEDSPAVIGAITQISGGDTSYSFSERPIQSQKNILKGAHKINLDEWVFRYTDQLQSHRIPNSYYSGAR